MEFFLVILLGVLGAVIGSFLNVCIDRLPAGKSLIGPPSHCDACNRRLGVLDLVPVVSYLVLRGRCRYCGARVPGRVFWVEVGSALFLALAYWYFGLSAQFAFIAFYGFVFIVLGVIDLEHKRILNVIVYPMSVVALILNLAIDVFQLPVGTIYNIVGLHIASSIIGGAAGFVFLLIPALISPKGMGFGDVKMAGLIGLATGFPLVFVALLLGAVLGALVALVLLLTGLKKRKEGIPFGPFLSLATIATLIWGSQILDLYLGIF